MYQTLGLEVHGHIAQLEFRRAQDHNAFNATMHREFMQALSHVRQLQDVRVLLLRAQGKSFIGGGDFDYLRQLRRDPALRLRTRQEAQDIFTLLNDMPFPLVAAVHGHALGFGATIVTSCDVIVAWQDAKLADPHVRGGLVAGDGGVLSWTAAAGITRAKRMLLTGDAMTMREAWQFGLVTDLVDAPEKALPEALVIANRIAALPPLAVQGTKRAFNALGKQQMSGAFEIGLLAEIASIDSEDIEEALTAAIEKRPGVFHNR